MLKKSMTRDAPAQRVGLICLITGVALAAVAPASPQAASRTGDAPFVATMSSPRGGSLNRRKIWYDHGRFRIEYYQGAAAAPVGIETYDRSHPDLAWAFEPGRDEAFLTPGSSTRAIQRAVESLGEKKARQRYGIPAGYPTRRRKLDPMLTPGLIRFYRSGKARPVGSRQVAGVACRVYESSADGTRLVVEPRSSLVMLEEATTGKPPGLLSPYQVVRMEFPGVIDRRKFQLPPGTAARLPEIFEGAPLPPGVKKASMPPGHEATGILF